MKKNKLTFFRTMNVVFLMLASVLLFFLGGLWIGSQEDYNELIQDSKLSFIVQKSLMSIMVSFTMVAVVYLIGRGVFRLKGMPVNKVALIDSIILVLTSIGTVLYHHC